ncbi:MAG: ABC transporter permease [Patescibacteria group bacterium]
MMVFEAIRMAVLALWSNKLRTFLAMLGVVIGIFSVVILVAAVQGVQKQAEDLIAGLGPTTLIVIPGASIEGNTPSFSQGFAASTLTEDDYEALKRGVEDISEYYAITFLNALTSSGDKKALPFIFANTKGTEKLFKLELDQGELLSEQDYAKGNHFAVIGINPLKKLEIEDPIGKKIKLGKEEFTIKGTYKALGQFLFGFNLDDIVVVPLKVGLELNNKKTLDRIYLVAKDKEAIPGVIEQTKAILKDRHGDEDFSILEQKDALKLLGNITSLLASLLGGIAAISLVVGGIGIMNIMLVSVTERTREIGIRKAIGAPDSAILLQFLTEALLITVIGAAIALGLSFGASNLAARFSPVKPDISWISIAWAVGTAVVVGLVFGLLPALRAARKNPIEALRYE